MNRQFLQGAIFGILLIFSAGGYFIGRYIGKLEAAETKIEYAGFRFVAKECVKIAQEQDERIKATIAGTKRALKNAAP